MTARLPSHDKRPVKTRVKQFRFELRDTSRKPGVCLNWPNKDCIVRLDRNRYMIPHRAVCMKLLVRVKDGLLRVFDGAELQATSLIPEGQGHLVADPELVRALKEDPEQNRLKYRRPPEGHKGKARTIGPIKTPWAVVVQVRPIADYLTVAGVGHK